jgi:hypothetical protein
MMETLQAQSALLIAQQHKMAMLERTIRIMGDRLRMHDTKFDCLAAVEPEVVNYPQWLPMERFRLLDAVRAILAPCDANRLITDDSSHVILRRLVC